MEKDKRLHRYYKLNLLITMKTKLFTLLLAVAASVGTMFASNTSVDGIWYNFNSTNKTAEVTYQGSYYSTFSNEYAGVVTIPASVTYRGTTYSVTSIGNNAFSNCSSLTSVTIPNSVKSIETGAFRECTALKSVTIPSSVTSIGGDAFNGCSRLTSVTIPNSVTSIGERAFGGCSGMTSVTIGNSVTSIGYAAFWGCSGLTSVTIPNSVTSIVSSAFEGCTGLTSVTIPSSVTSIGERAFYGCTNLPIENNIRYAGSYLVEAVNKTLSSYSIKTGTKWIGSAAFENCSNLCSITIPNSVTSIGYAAFRDCRGLTSIEIPNSVTSIDDYAVYGCSGLASVTIPNSVTSIGAWAFSSCTGLFSVEIPNSVTNIGNWAFNMVRNIVYTGSAGGSQWGALSLNGFVDGYMVYKDATKTELLSCSLAVNGEVVIPNIVTSIGVKAFSGCSGLTSVAIPNSVTSIGEDAFAYCSSLTSVTLNSNAIVSQAYSRNYGLKSIFGNQVPKYIIGDSVTSIGAWAFAWCYGLTSVTIGNSVKSIGESAFYECGGLTSIEIPNSVTSIGGSAFENSGVETINFIGSIEDWCNKIWSPSCISSNYQLLFNGVIQKNVIIPSSVTSIGDEAFKNCSGLTSLVVGNSVTSIGQNAFYSCTGLTSVVWNAKNCSSSGNFGSQVTSFTFGEEVEVIPPSACSGMTNLTSITIPSNVTSIGSSAFQGCSGLTSVVWNAKNCSSSGNFGSQVTSFTFGEEVEVIPPSACSGMTNLTSITIPNSVTSIGNNAFLGCTGLTSVTIPNSVTSIGSSAFQGCSGLTSVTIPNSVTSIVNNAFYDCSGLTSVTIPNSVNNIGNSAFQGCTGLTSVTIPNSVTNIGDNAFYECSGLTSVTIGNSVTSIGGGAFSSCTGLASVTVNSNSVIRNNLKNIFGSQVTQYIIGSDITSIPNTISIGYSNLTSIVVESGNSTYDSRNDCNAIIETATNSLISGCKNTVIPNSVTSIGESAFYGCTGLTSVTIGNRVTSIGTWAFYNCSGLTSVTIPNSVTSIGGSAFRTCSSLTSVTIPNSVTSIGDGAFWNCSSLTSVTVNSNSIIGNNLGNIFGLQVTQYIIGSDITSIPNTISIGYSNLTSIVVESGNSTYDSRNDCNAIIETATNSLISGCKNTVIPDNVTRIDNNAFYGCSGLTLIEIPNSVTSIGDQAFRGCSGLTSIEIPNSVTSIGDRAFDECSGLTSVTIGNSITSIGGGAFSWCSSLTSVTIPNSVTSIGAWAFAWCYGLTSVTCLATTPPVMGYEVFNEVYCSNILLYVPIESVSLYQAANIWKEFNVIGVMFADEVETAVFSATPTDDSGVILEWQAIENATLYNIEIKQGNNTVRQLQFDSNGKLLNNPSNAPSRYANVRYSSTAEYTANGWRCEVNDLDPGTSYTYSITVKAENGSVLYTQSIGFATKEETFIIKFVNWNGEELLVLPDVVKGTTPSYTGETPVRPNTAEYTYTFAGWDPAIVVVTGDATYTATFSSVVNVYTITVNAVNGQVLGGGEYQYGTTTDLTAIPDEGYVFDQWSDGVTDNPRTITVTGDAEYTALFTSTEGLENIYTSEPVQKVMIDQKVYILRGDKVYTLQGQEVK